MDRVVQVCIHGAVSCVSSPRPPPPWYGPPMIYTRNQGCHCCLKSANSHRDGPPEPAIFVSVVAFEAMQLRGVSKVAALTWMGHGFGLRRAQLLTLNPNPFISIHISPNNPATHRGGAGANPKPYTQHPPPHHREGGRGLNTKPETHNPPPQHATPHHRGGEEGLNSPKPTTAPQNTHHHATTTTTNLSPQHTTPHHRGEKGGYLTQNPPPCHGDEGVKQPKRTTPHHTTGGAAEITGGHARTTAQETEGPGESTCGYKGG